jgi:hypothetical protein
MRSRILFGLTALVLGAATASTVAVPRASAAGTDGPNVSSTMAPTWQTNDTVWALAVANGVVYAGGSFTSVRPPGDPSGTGEVARSYLAAFSASTGDLLSFNPTLDGTVRALAVSPDKNTLYVGGNFTHVNGSYREYLAAFNIANSPPTLSSTWKPHAGASVRGLAPSPDGAAVYIGGNFGTLGGTTRNHAGAVDTSGNLLPWNPNLNGSVDAVAVAPDDSRVLLGGWFTSIGGVMQNSIASTNPSTGANEPWAATILPHNSTCTSAVKDIITDGSTAYIAAEGTGGGCFDGDFAANISDGSLIWQNDCLGATQALVIINGLLYKGSHAHDCAYAPGGFPQVRKPSGNGWVTWHLLDQSLADGSLGHWTPNTNGVNLGPRVFATDGSQIFVGGAFTTVNGVSQQGLTRFPAGPDTTKPKFPAAPTAISTSAGVDSVTFNGVSDRDSGTLTYSIYRDSSTTPIGTVTATSWPWALPVIHYRDAGLTAGTTHTYRIRVSDGTNTTWFSSASAPVTVSGTNPSHTYVQTVLNSNPSFLWQLDETSGSTAFDSSPNNFKGIYEPGTTQGMAGPMTGTSATATAFDGKTGLVTAAKAVSGPQTFSIELWFKTSTNTGGKLVGFGNSQTGRSTSYDRHIYMMNDGQLVFGVYNGQPETIETPAVYNDGKWHYVVATIGSAGMALYVDGQRTGTNSTTSPQEFTGYWRVGGDNLRGWDLDPWTNSQGLTQPNSYYFQGTIGDVAVYPYAMSASRVAAHYAANALSH